MSSYLWKLGRDVDRASRTLLAYRLRANSFVAPFLDIEYQTATDALMAAQVSEGNTDLILGCGDGRVCTAACSRGLIWTRL